MEKFMFLFRGSEVYHADQSPQALEALKQKMMAWVGDIISKDIHVSSAPFQRKGVQVIGKEKSVFEHPFGSLKDIVGGCTIIQAGDINEAMEIAKSCPILETNAVIEIRPIDNI